MYSKVTGAFLIAYMILPSESPAASNAFIRARAIRHMTLDNDCNFIGGSNIPERHL